MLPIAWKCVRLLTSLTRDQIEAMASHLTPDQQSTLLGIWADIQALRKRGA